MLSLSAVCVMEKSVCVACVLLLVPHRTDGCMAERNTARLGMRNRNRARFDGLSILCCLFRLFANSRCRGGDFRIALAHMWDGDEDRWRVSSQPTRRRF